MCRRPNAFYSFFWLKVVSSPFSIYSLYVLDGYQLLSWNVSEGLHWFFFFLLLPQTALWFSVSFFSATLLWSHQLHFISPISSLLILCDCFIAESINNMVLLISSMLSFSMKGWNRLSRPGREASKKLEFGNLLLGWPFLGNKNDCSVSLFIGTGTGGPVSW